MIVVEDVPRIGRLEIPDCRCCRDTGQVMCPTIEWRQRTYLGHQPGCACGTCADWPQAMREWAEGKARENPSRAVPAEAVAAIAAGTRGLRYREIVSCPLCGAGDDHQEWLLETRDRKAGKAPYRPAPARVISYHRREGREAADLYLLERGETAPMKPPSLQLVGRAVGSRMDPAGRLNHRPEPVEETAVEIAAARAERERQREAARDRGLI